MAGSRNRPINGRVVARANSYSAALKLIVGTDYLAMPRRIQQLLANEPGFSHYEAPQGLPGFSLDMLWSEASDLDSANTWLREQVTKACAAQALD